MKKVLIAIASLALVVGIAPASQAVQTIQLSPVTNLDPAGDYVHAGFAAFPAGKDFYLYEAVKPAAGARPTVYSADQTWVSNSQGATSPKGDIKVKVSGAFGTADCSKDICGIFVRYGHESNGSTDTSEDQFFPISFKAGSAAPALPSDVITVTMDGTAISGQTPGTLAYRTPKTLVVKTTSGAAVTITSSTPDCSANGSTIEALKGSGICDFAVKSEGNASYAAKTSHFPFNLALGVQKADAKFAALKVGKSATLAGLTNFGEKVTYTSNTTKNCSVKGAKVIALKNGSCVIKASALATANYAALATMINIKISK